jgi:hypothetical protein
VKHATPVALDALEGLLRELRNIEGLIERKRGLFYRGGGAFIHFHEDRAGFFADAKVTPMWVRFDVTTQAQRRAFLREVRTGLRAPASARPKQLAARRGRAQTTAAG